jgi:hypothetical protein
MGVWGTAIFSDDNAADLREDYRRLIGDGINGPEATDRLLKEWSPEGDPALEPVFWLALAVTQWSCGRLEERVKAKALGVIDDGSAIAEWRGGADKLERKRQAVLDATRKKLESPQPAARPIKKRVLATCDWDRGELIAYRLVSGDWIVLRMLDPWTDLGGSYPVCELFDWRAPDLPAAGVLDSTAVLRQRDRHTRIMILPIGKRLVKKDRIVRLNVKHVLAEDYSRKPRGVPNPTRVATWRGFDEILATDYGLR